MTLRRPISMALLLALAVGGCSKPEHAALSPSAANVNGDVVSVQQIKSVLTRDGKPPEPEQFKAAAPSALETLIEQQLMVQAAAASKVDQEATVVEQVENARKQIVAQAYLEKIMSAAPKPTQIEIQDFYDKNPMLFAQRRIFRIQELGANLPPEKLEDLRKQAQAAKSLQELGAWLKGQNIPYGAGETAKPAEQLPMELLATLARMSDGQIAMFPTPGGVAILQVMQSQLAPYNLQQATPFIEKFLTNGKRLELAKAEAKKLRAAAKVEYAGDFQPASAPAAASGVVR